MRDQTGNHEHILQSKTEEELPVPWQKIQGALWLVGIAFLLWRGSFFPGILVLVALSGLFQAGVMFYLKNQEAQKAQATQVDQLAKERESWLPSVCPSCGAPINLDLVRWTGQRSGSCPYCSANLKPGG